MHIPTLTNQCVIKNILAPYWSSTNDAHRKHLHSSVLSCGIPSFLIPCILWEKHSRSARSNLRCFSRKHKRPLLLEVGQKVMFLHVGVDDRDGPSRVEGHPNDPKHIGMDHTAEFQTGLKEFHDIQAFHVLCVGEAEESRECSSVITSCT